MKPPCQWIIDHLEEVPVRCGDDFAVFLGDLPVCLSHFEFNKLHSGAW